jgi:hypothetical protein
MRPFSLLLALGCLFPAVAAAQTDTGQTPEAVVRANIAAENAHDVDRILATLAERVDFRIHMAGHADSTFALTSEQQRETYDRAVRLAPNVRFQILEQIVSGPVVVSREEISGLEGGARQVGLTVYRVEHGRIVSLWILDVQDFPAGG